MPKYSEETRAGIKALEFDLASLRRRLTPGMDPKKRAKLIAEIEGHKNGIKDLKNQK